jgi:thioredoxin 1
MKWLYVSGFVIIGAFLGSIMGYYGKCSSGACPLTATPIRGALWGAFLALLFAMSFFAEAGDSKTASERSIEISDESKFELLVLKSQTPCVVDFYADWCSPCQELIPIFSALSGKYSWKIKFFRVNIDKIPSLKTSHSVEKMPCVIFFKNGEEVSRILGLEKEKKYAEEAEKLF